MDEDAESGSALRRFVALVRRETHASDVRVLPARDEPSSAPNVLSLPLGDGRNQLFVVFAETPQGKEALTRRLEMLVGTFAQALDGNTRQMGRTPRPPVARSLRDELSALATRARAVDALVIDAHSPIVWGAAIEPAVAGARSDDSSVELMAVPPEKLGGVHTEEGGQDLTTDARTPADGPKVEELAALSALAARRVREHPAIPSLHKGGRLHSVVRGAELGYVAHSFASIYVLVLVYPGSAPEPFDELRAERSVSEALPRIERLVLALPPRDPPPAPVAGVLAFRRRRRP